MRINHIINVDVKNWIFDIEYFILKQNFFKYACLTFFRKKKSCWVNSYGSFWNKAFDVLLRCDFVPASVQVLQAFTKQTRGLWQ